VGLTDLWGNQAAGWTTDLIPHQAGCPGRAALLSAAYLRSQLLVSEQLSVPKVSRSQEAPEGKTVEFLFPLLHPGLFCTSRRLQAAGAMPLLLNLGGSLPLPGRQP
jgi:hypothetical protein